jgi:hypothetical protein
MNYFSDALTIGIVLVLLFGSVALYLYTRIQQTEQKNSLLESILLDLKMNAEMKSYSELPADEENVSIPVAPLSAPSGGYTSFEPTIAPSQPSSPKEKEIQEDAHTVDIHEVEQYSSVIDDAVNEVVELSESIDTGLETIQMTKMDELDGYEEMKLKELHELARSRGITGASTMKKNVVIEALRTHDRSSTLKSGSSLVDTSEVLSFE